MSGISLNASMRSNLLSLQNISKLQDTTQLRLSTGLKVNSAIDNPSSYYTASSLTNRADDLSALLDAMGQGIQTIKAANEGIEKAEDFISQMKAVAEQASSGGSNKVPEKAYFEKEVGTNGAVVTTAEELRNAVNSGKETICIYGKIDLGDISTSGGLQLQENQKLVGVNYFGNFADGEDFSSISATASTNQNLIDIKKTGCLVSNLDINYKNMATSGSAYCINVSGIDVVADLQDLKIDATFDENNASGKAIITGQSSATINILKNLEISSNNSCGIYGNANAAINILSESYINIQTAGINSYGIYTLSSSSTHIQYGANIDIKTSGAGNYGIYNYYNSTINIEGNLNIITLEGAYGIINSNVSGNRTNISSTAKIYLNTGASGGIYNGKADGTNGTNILEIAKGAKIAFEKNGKTSWYHVNNEFSQKTDTTTNQTITADTFATTVSSETTSSWQTPSDIIAQELAQAEEQAALEQENLNSYQKQFNDILSQYDMLIKDSSYKGINLLLDDHLKINFNEDKSANVLVEGVDVASKSIVLLEADWQSQNDVQKSLEQISNAKNTIRTAASELGNYYSIITTREDFTNNLINVLEEGADKLTLADMNEESANMLALQTRQSLAVNSLSLASQASQAILKLF